MSDFTHDQESAIARFYSLLTTALGLPETRLDLSQETPACILDLSPVLGDLIPANPKMTFASKVPVLFTTASRLQDKWFSDLVRQIVHALGAVDVSLIFVFPFIEQAGLEERRVKLKSDLRSAGQHLVLFGREDVGDILASPSPQRQLRTFVLSQIDLTYVSPYFTAGLVSHQVFFGREREMREILDHIVQVSHAVIGSRRIGKTSILRRLSDIHLPGAGFQTLYLDCSPIASYPDLMREKLRNWYPPNPDSMPDTFGDLLLAPPAGRPLIILLDEVDKLLHDDRLAAPAQSWPLCSKFRSFSNNGYGTFVLAGERTLREALKDSTSPLFNFVKVVRLGQLDYHAVEELVVKPMKQLEIVLTDEGAITRRIWDVTSGHPAVVQRLCDRLVTRLSQHALRRLTPADVDDVVADPDFIRSDFLATYLSQATLLEHLVVLLMAKDASLTTGDAIHQTLHSDGLTVTLNQVVSAAERLVDLRNILRRTEDGYVFAVPAFQRIIPSHKQLPLWIRLRREMFLWAGDILPENAPKDLRGDLWG